MRGAHEGGSMKAWRVRDEAGEVGCCTVVFAETRGKAHALAMNTDCCEDAEWNDVSVKRLSAMDKMYKGRNEMDWFNAEDRIALVKECGWVCSDEWVDYERDCPNCPAEEWCDAYCDYKSESERIW